MNLAFLLDSPRAILLTQILLLSILRTAIERDPGFASDLARKLEYQVSEHLKHCKYEIEKEDLEQFLENARLLLRRYAPDEFQD